MWRMCQPSLTKDSNRLLHYTASETELLSFWKGPYFAVWLSPPLFPITRPLHYQTWGDLQVGARSRAMVRRRMGKPVPLRWVNCILGREARKSKAGQIFASLTCFHHFLSQVPYLRTAGLYASNVNSVISKEGFHAYIPAFYFANILKYLLSLVPTLLFLDMFVCYSFSQFSQLFSFPAFSWTVFFPRTFIHTSVDSFNTS